MKIDWRSIPEGIEGYDFIPDTTDWTDPTHAPLMVAEVVEAIGNLDSVCLSDAEHLTACGIAIDAMPRGELAVREDVEGYVRGLAAAGDWSEWLYEPGTRRYPWEDSE